MRAGGADSRANGEPHGAPGKQRRDKRLGS